MEKKKQFSVSNLYTFILFEFIKWACIKSLFSIWKKNNNNNYWFLGRTPSLLCSLAFTVLNGVKIKGKEIYPPRCCTISLDCGPWAKSFLCQLQQVQAEVQRAPHHSRPC